jgi:hypothetical protein
MKFIEDVNKVEEPVYLTNGTDFKVSAKSMLGTLIATVEWDQIYCECERDIFSIIHNYTID